MQQRWYNFVGSYALFCIVVLAVIASFTYIAVVYQQSSNTPYQEQVNYILETCAEESYRPACYDREIPKVMDRGYSFEDAFAITKAIQRQDDGYWYCHVLGHNLSAKEAEKDLEKWTDVVSRCPQGTCSNGCLHGAFQARFRGARLSEADIQALLPELTTICTLADTNRGYTGLEQASCYHALGHLTMYITGNDHTRADIFTALDICDQVARTDSDADFLSLCYDGAFMQIFQPLEPEDELLVEEIAPASTAAAAQFCNQFTGLQKTSCHIESWPLSIDAMLEDERGIEDFCQQDFTKENAERCRAAMFNVVAAQTQYDADKVTALCRSVSFNNRDQCYQTAATRFIETDYELKDEAVAVCNAANAEGLRPACFEELVKYSTFNYIPDSKEFVAFCDALPNPWSDMCFKQGQAESQS